VNQFPHSSSSVGIYRLGIRLLPEAQDSTISPMGDLLACLEAIQIHQEFLSRLITQPLVLLKAVENQGIQFRRKAGIKVRQVWRIDPGQLMGQGGEALGLHHRLSRDHLIEDDPHLIDVCGGGGLASQKHLRSHVARRSQAVASLGDASPILHLGEAKIHEHGTARAQNHDVSRLQIPVDDPQLMDVPQGQAKLATNTTHLFDGEAPLLLQQILKGFSLQHFHGVPVAVLLHPSFKDPDNVGALGLTAGRNLSLEAGRHGGGSPIFIEG
jgi:hypothetical protein